MPYQTSFVSAGKRHLIFFAILGPAVTLLLGIILGLQTDEDLRANFNQTTQAFLHDIISLNMKRYQEQINSVRPMQSSKSDNFLAEEIADLWRSELDKVDVLPYDLYGVATNLVVGYVFGKKEKDRFIILGNNRSFGNTGTPVVMVLVRSFGQLVRSIKWRPLRTIVFCSFAVMSGPDDATWINALEKNLFSRAVVYFDINNVIEGNLSLSGSGSPNLRKAVIEAAKVVENPNAEETGFGRSHVYDTWFHNSDDKDQPNFPLFQIPSKNKNLLILHKTGVPFVNLRYSNVGSRVTTPLIPKMGGDFGIYDPHSKFSVALAQMFAQLSLRFSNEWILPFTPSDYFHYVDKMVSIFFKQYTPVLESHGIHNEHLGKALKKFENTINELEKLIESTNRRDDRQVRILNDKLGNFDRIFLDMTTLYSGNHHHHILFGVGDSKCPNCCHLPRVRSAVLNAEISGSWNEVAKQLSALDFYIDTAAMMLSDLN